MNVDLMADTEAELFCPGQREVAFAVIIVQSKPSELTISEYIRLLRQHVAKGRRENALSSAYRHLDRSAFWRSECERTQQALQVSEDQVARFKIEIEKLKAKIENIKSGPPTKKRKKPDIDTIPVPRSPKKAKRESSPTRALPTSVDFATGGDYHDAGEIGNVLLRSVFSVLSALKKSQRPDADDLAHHIMQATSAIPQIVQREVERIITEEASSNDLLSDALTVASRAAGVVLLAYSKLSHGPNTVQGRAAYAVVRMFKDLLRDFELLSIDEAENGAEINRIAASETSPAKAKGKAKTGKAANIKTNPKLGLYTNFLNNIIDKLDPKLEANKDIYEGLAYCLLERLGSRLYTAAFGQQRATTLEDEIRQSAEEKSLENDDTATPQREISLELQQTRLEAPYLVHLLNRLMSTAPIHLGSVKGRNSTAKSATKKSLAVSARDCLQSTLVNCVFGVEGENEDDLFRDCLKMPSAPADPITMPRVKEADVQDWFKDELWRMLGWEILAKEGNW